MKFTQEYDYIHTRLTEIKDCLKRPMQENCMYSPAKSSDIPSRMNKSKGVSSSLLDKTIMKKQLLCLMIAIALSITAALAMAEDKPVVAFEADSYAVDVGKTQTIKPVIQNYKGKTTYEYSSSDESIATVTNNGAVKGISAGTAEISCTVTTADDTFKLSYTLTVNQPIKSIQCDVKSKDMHSDETFQPEITILPENATNKKLKWTSSNEEVAKVDDNGLITADKVGKCTITGEATDGSRAKVQIKINIPLITLTTTDITIDSPEGADFSFWTNSRYGISMIDFGIEGDCCTDSGGFGGSVHLTPVKVGNCRYVVKVNGNRKVVKIKVTRNAVYEPASYEKIGKNDKDIGMRFSFKGTVVKVEKEDGKATVVLNADDQPGQFVVCSTTADKVHSGIVVDEKVTAKGIFKGFTDYTADNGLSYKVPAIDAENIALIPLDQR